MTSRLSSLLVQDGLVSAKRMADAFQRQVIYGGTLDTNLLEMRVVEEDVLLAYLGRASGLPTQPAGITALGKPTAETLKIFSKEIAERFRAVPCGRVDGTVLRVLVADPVEPQDMESLAQSLHLRVEPWIGPEFRVMEGMDVVYGEALPSRFHRLLARSNQAHEQKGLPPPRVIDPVPRFGSLHEFGADLPPLPSAPPAPPVPIGRVAAPIIEASAPIPVPPPPQRLTQTALDLAWTEEATMVEEAAVLDERPVSGHAPPEEEPDLPAPPPITSAPSGKHAAPRESVPELIPEESAPVVPVKISPAPQSPRPPVSLSTPPAAARAEEPAAKAEEPAAKAPELAQSAEPAAKAPELAQSAEPAAKAPELAQSAEPAAKTVEPSPIEEPAAKAVEPSPIEEPAAKTAEPVAAKAEDPAAQADERAPIAEPVAAKAEEPVALEEPAAKAEEPAAPAAAQEPAVARAEEPAAPEAAPAPAPSAATPAPEPARSEAGGKKKKRRRGGEAPRVPPPSPIVAKPVITPPARGAERPVAREPSVVISDLPSEVGPSAAVPQRMTAEHTPLPSPLPPPSDLSGPLSSLVSSSLPAVSAPAGRVSEPVPVPIDSGRLGEQLVRGGKAGKGASGPSREAARVAVAIGEPRPSALSFEAAREIIAGAEDRDLIFETLCRAVRGRVSFAAVFTVHGDVAFGRCALGDGWLDRQGLGKVAVPLDRPSAFRIAVKGRSPHLGRIGDQPAAGDALASLGRRPPLPGAVLPVLVRGRTLALLYLDDEGRDVRSDLLEELRPLMIEVSQAFQRLVLRSRAGGFSGSAEEGARRGQVESEMLAPNTSAWRSNERGERGERDKRGRSTLARFPAQGGDSAPKVIEVRGEEGAGSAVPRASTEQPTTRLRPEGSKRPQPEPSAAGAEAREPGAEAATEAAGARLEAAPEARPEIEARTEPQPEAQIETRADARTDARTEAMVDLRPAPEPEPAAEPAQPAQVLRLEPPEAARPVQPAEGQAPLPTLTELVGRAAAGDESAVEQLLGEGEDAARAVVMALPGPLKSRERQAMGDPIGEPVFARGPLLSLVPRLGKAAVQPLLERLENPVTPPEVRYYVALCFTELPVEAAVRPLGHRLFDSDDAVRMAAVTALRSCPTGGELRDLLETLRSDLLGPDARRQQHAAEALGELRDVQAVPRLVQLLSHDDMLLGNAAARALQTITKQDFGRSRFRWRMWWRRHQSEPRLQWMLCGLSHDSVAVRASAQDELRGLCGDVAGYRFDQPRRDREAAQRRWTEWWQRRGYPVYAP